MAIVAPALGTPPPPPRAAPPAAPAPGSPPPPRSPLFLLAPSRRQRPRVRVGALRRLANASSALRATGTTPPTAVPAMLVAAGDEEDDGWHTGCSSDFLRERMAELADASKSAARRPRSRFCINVKRRVTVQRLADRMRNILAEAGGNAGTMVDDEEPPPHD